ncbi:MAG TPA: erythromycin esterase family protein [Methanothrix sp.]|nr:erythromycin esterase family protein [Methanothrix sp.]HPR65625.1 erythromycin esterase family protein [Methanothrix sp.]
MIHSILDDWICSNAISFPLDSSKRLSKAIDRVIASLSDSVELLGFGEALHGGEEVLLLRNRIFQRLVEVHGYSAIAIESSFPRGRAVNEYVAGRGPASYEAVMETGFSHGLGHLEANRELVEWMRVYNSDPAHRIKLRFYGFDSPTEMTFTDSPSRVLHFVLDYLASIDDASAGGRERRKRIDSLLGEDPDWENPAAMMDPAESVGLSTEATELRIETEDLISELSVRRPELVAKSGKNRYLEAVHYAKVARQLLNYHAVLARKSSDRIALGLGLRDFMMADNLEYIVSCERGRGKVLVYAHNSHLSRGRAEWQLGADFLRWWPAGAHLAEIFGPRYAVVGTAVGVSDENGIGEPEAGTLEAGFAAASGPGSGLFIPTRRDRGLSASEIEGLTIRLGSAKNTTYFPLTPRSLTDFDGLAFLDGVGYSRGGPALL